MAANVRLGHVAIPAQQPAALAQFYHAVLGLEESLTGTLPTMGDFVFLSDRGEAPLPLIAFVTRAQARHIAWEVESLAALQRVYADAKALGAPILFAFHHRVTVSLYLQDPEGNMVEAYWPTGRADKGVYADPIDLTLFEQDEAALRAAVSSAVAS
jgi:catechol-2,3-dioxygenase